MGSLMSTMGKGIPSQQMLDFFTASLYEQFVSRDIKTPEAFQDAILELLNDLNSSLPGKHYDLPSREQIRTFLEDWNKITDPDSKKDKFIDFMTKNIKQSKADYATVATGVITPPAAMAAKRAGENLPQLKVLKLVPDVLLVPSVTVVAIVYAKLCRRRTKLESSGNTT